MADFKKNTFAQNLEYLIELFSKLKQRSLNQKLPGIDKTFFDNFDYIAQNYKSLKKDIPDEVLERFGQPIQQMVEQMVEQLIEELEQDEPNEIEDNELTEDLKEIDLLLRNPLISCQEINELLDQRNAISSKIRLKRISRRC